MLRKIPPEILIVLASCILFLPFLGGTYLFDWDEINFAEVSREMIVTKNYLIPQVGFEPFWEKPPLFFWLQVISMKIFGINEFAARFPNAVCGAFTLIVLYRTGKKIVDEKFGWLWVLIYVGSLLPQFYFKSGIIDSWFNLFIFLSVVKLVDYAGETSGGKLKEIIMAGLFAGLAIMTKGPVGLLIIGLTYMVFAAFTSFRLFKKPLHLLFFLAVAAIAGSIWFIALWLSGNQHILYEFIQYQLRLFESDDMPHRGPFFYHFVVLLIGCFPATALALASMHKKEKNDVAKNYFHRCMLILFWITLLLFSIVRTKIVHYSSLCYFPLTYFAAVSFYQFANGKWKMPRWSKWLQFSSGLLLSLLLISLCFIEQIKPHLLPYIKDEFAKASLSAEVHWSGWEIIPGLLLFAGLVLFMFYVKKNTRRSLLLLFVFTMVSINLAILLIAPKAQAYSQDAAIEFYKSKQGQNVVVETLRFKSYAQLFYTQRPAHFTQTLVSNVKHKNTNPEIETYFVGQVNKRRINESELWMEMLYEKNGFVFYRRLK